MVGLAGLALGSLASPAFASPPADWSDSTRDGPLDFLLVIVGIPLAVILVITLLVYLPSMIRGRSTEPAVVFHDRSEWFGGPREAPDATGSTSEESQDRGGASARW
jgi:hypothetical protein